jgi:nicotinamidase-related amidase
MAETGALDLAVETTALVVIDLQKGIVGRPAEPHAAADVVANAARLANAMREKGGFVVLVNVSFGPNRSDALHPVSDDPGWGSTSLPPDWADIVTEMGPRPGDHLVTKKQWGAFYGTDLELQLRRRNIRTLILCGISTCFGVESTARDAYEHGFEQVFVEDAMASRSADEHAHTVTRIFPRIGRVRSTAEALAALR